MNRRELFTSIPAMVLGIASGGIVAKTSVEKEVNKRLGSIDFNTRGNMRASQEAVAGVIKMAKVVTQHEKDIKGLMARQAIMEGEIKVMRNFGDHLNDRIFKLEE